MAIIDLTQKSAAVMRWTEDESSVWCTAAQRVLLTGRFLEVQAQAQSFARRSCRSCRSEQSHRTQQKMDSAYFTALTSHLVLHALSYAV